MVIFAFSCRLTILSRSLHPTKLVAIPQNLRKCCLDTHQTHSKRTCIMVAGCLTHNSKCLALKCNADERINFKAEWAIRPTLWSIANAFAILRERNHLRSALVYTHLTCLSSAGNAFQCAGMKNKGSSLFLCFVDISNKITIYFGYTSYTLHISTLHLQ